MVRLSKPLIAMFASLLLATPALAMRVQDVTRLSDEIPNEIGGMGIVFGLKGTGDGGDFIPAAQALGQLLEHYNNPVDVATALKNASNFAIVNLSVEMPPQGTRVGDKLDIKVSSFGSAKSLKNGRLFFTPLTDFSKDNPHVFATGSGVLQLDDEQNPTTATIKGGAVMQRNFAPQNVSGGKFMLVLRPAVAGYSVAAAIADVINEDVKPQTDGKPMAFAVDATSVVVTIPPSELANTTAFIARIQALPVPSLPSVAKVLINSKTGSIVFSGDVELSPTMISHKGLTITVSAPNAAPNPPGSTVGFLALDPNKQGGTKLKDLVDSFNLLKVSADDRIIIVKQLVEIGALKCDLTVE